MLDGVLQAILPSYSTTALISFVCLVAHIALASRSAPGLIYAWAFLAGMLAVYPFLGLALERAPWKAYKAILFGPFFVLWRTWTALVVRLRRRPVAWVRTARRTRQ